MISVQKPIRSPTSPSSCIDIGDYLGTSKPVALPQRVELNRKIASSNKVIVENVTTTSTKNSAVAWIIIGILAVALIAYIVVHLR